VQPGAVRQPIEPVTGVPPTNPPVQPGLQPTPGFPPPSGATPVTAQPAPATPGFPPPPPTGEGAPGGQAAGIPPVTATPAPPTDALQTPPAAPPGVSSPPPAQVIITAPPELRVATGPTTVPISVNNASRLSTMTLTGTLNAQVLHVRSVQEGTFMRQGNVTATFTPSIDGATGRVDIAVTRVGDQAGASGTGLIAALLVDAVGPGTSTIQVSGVASTPEGSPVELLFAPVTVTAR
jgi:hypothetical protein